MSLFLSVCRIKFFSVILCKNHFVSERPFSHDICLFTIMNAKFVATLFVSIHYLEKLFLPPFFFIGLSYSAFPVLNAKTILYTLTMQIMTSIFFQDSQFVLKQVSVAVIMRLLPRSCYKRLNISPVFCLLYRGENNIDK